MIYRILKTHVILKSLLISCGLALGGTSLNAQVDVDMTMTVEELVQNVLLGNGVSVSNITFNGAPADQVNVQIGRFHGTSQVVEFPEGLVLGTHNVRDLVLAEFGGDPMTNPVDDDPDLAILAAEPNMNDGAILEFDFIPNGDSLEFRYVFASEEYPLYTCSQYNDAFGFFISGPGFNGPFSNNAENIALIPGSNTPVAINTVNSGTPSGFNDPDACQNANPNWQQDTIYFVDNDPPASDEDVQIAGMTTTLTAYANVICGETYHIKIGIADAVDGALNSAVFLESESFASNSTVQVTLDIPVGVNDSTLYEGCGEAALQFIRPAASQGIEETAYLEIGGTATNGVDYVPELPDSVVFPPGIDTVSFYLTAAYDGINEGEETVHILITNIASDCSGAELTSEFQFYIREPDPLEVSGFDTSLVDCHDEVDLFPIVTGGYGEYSFDWTNGATSDTVTVSPGYTTTYFVTVGDTCGVEPLVAQFEVDVPVYPPVHVTMPPDTLIETCNVSLPITPEVTGGFGQYTFSWYDDGEYIGTGASFNYYVEQTSEVVAVVHDDCGALGSDTMMVSLPEVQVSTYLPDGYVAQSCTEEIMLPVVAEGGIGDLTYYWSVDGVPQDTTSNLYFIYHPSMGQTVVVTAEDNCQNTQTDSTFIEWDYPEIELRTIADTSICKNTSAVLYAEALGGSGSFKYHWQSAPDSTTTLTVSPQSDRNYYLTVTDTCGMSAEAVVNVEIRQVRADFDYLYIHYYGLQLTNYSRGEDLSYLWDFGDGTTSMEENPKHHFKGLDKYRVTLTATDPKGCWDTTYFETQPPSELFIPSSFTPNGDGINDLFGVVGANVTEFDMWIYDRYGREVFHTDNVNDKWNGATENSEYYPGSTVFNYLIRYKGELKEDAVEITGFVTLIR